MRRSRKPLLGQLRRGFESPSLRLVFFQLRGHSNPRQALHPNAYYSLITQNTQKSAIALSKNSYLHQLFFYLSNL